MRRADEDRFREFARGQVAGLRRSAFLLCGDWHLAEDLVQNALIKMHNAWPRITHRHQPISYARKTLIRCWLDERRRPWRRREQRDGHLPDGADAAADPAEAHQRKQVRDELFRALAEVPPRQRAALVLRYFESLSVTEAADVLGCSEGTVKSQTARGLAALRAALERDREALTLTRETP
jgi:RNA polymerase sigma-70 factor (sigma-E family)